MRDGRIDFAEVARAALAQAESLVPQWLPDGRRQGNEWVAPSLTHSSRRSLSTNLVTGAWADFAGDERGGDLVSLYAAVHRLGQLEAARELAAHLGLQPVGADAIGTPAAARTTMVARQATSPTPAPPPTGQRAAPDWVPVHPVPDDAPDYRTQWGHYARGLPKLHWPYRDRQGRLLGVVCRFEASDGSKDVQPLSWCRQPGTGRHEWRYKAFAEPRPLYGLDRLPAEPAADQLVVMVEGEKCADALWGLLGPEIPVLAWPGGARAVGKVDFGPLAAVNVICWPDADAKVDKGSGLRLPLERQPGMLAMRQVQAMLARLGNHAVRVTNVGAPGDLPDGWDCADAIVEGWTRNQCLLFLGNLLPDESSAAHGAAPAQPAEGAVVAAGGAGGAGGPPTPGRAGAGQTPGDEWRARLIWRNAWSLRECVPNVMEVLAHHPAWAGVLGWDDFAQRIVKRKASPADPPGAPITSDEWADVDDTRAAVWVAQHERFVPSSAMVAEAVNVVARMHSYHPVLDWLRTLRHDGTPRLDHWMVDLLHVADTPYARLVSRYFLIGMCMRVLVPGCKFDYCLVLEGRQGRRKSTALRVLAGPWFSDTELDLANKDSMSAIRGKWLHEFGEMGSIARAESTRQKSFLSRQVDEFRPSYGRREIRCPRQSAFAGTTNEWAWNKDPTGGRRFWPLEVGDDIDTDGLQAVREQLFAEAYAAALDGQRYWPSAEEQRELFDPEQLAREAPEAFVELLSAWIEGNQGPVGDFTLAQAITDGLRIEARSITRDIQTRVGIALAKLGCERVERRDQTPRFVYRRVRRKSASSQPQVGGSKASNDAVEVPF